MFLNGMAKKRNIAVLNQIFNNVVINGEYLLDCGPKVL